MKKLGKIMSLYLLLALFIGLFACSDRLFTERKIMSSELTSNVQTREIKVNFRKYLQRICCEDDERVI